MIYIILSVLIIIILACLGVYLVYPIREKFKSHDWKAFGTTPPIHPESPKPFRNKVVADGNPYIDTLPLDPNKTLTKSMDNPFKAYNLGMLDYSKMTTPLTTPLTTDKNKLQTFGDFKPIELTDAQLNEYNKTTNINRANEININENVDIKYISSKIKDINVINQFVLKELNKNQQLVVSKELIMKNGLKDFIMYSYKLNGILQNKQNNKRYQLILNLIKQGGYFNPTIYVDAMVVKKKVYIYKCEFVGEYNTSETLLVNGYIGGKHKDDNVIIPINYERDPQIIKNVDTVIKERDKYLKEQQLTSQYACFNTDPSIALGKGPVYKRGSNGKPEALKEYTMLNFYDKQDCEKVYNFLGGVKKRGVWDRPCKRDKDCPFYKGNKNYENTFGKCNQGTGQCELPLNMQNIGYHYFYPEKELAPLCYNCDSNRWLPMTDLSKCCDEQNNKDKYPFLDGPDYAFHNDYQTRINSYMQKNCKLKSLGKNNIDNNIKCKKDIYNLY